MKGFQMGRQIAEVKIPDSQLAIDWQSRLQNCHLLRPLDFFSIIASEPSFLVPRLGKRNRLNLTRNCSTSSLFSMTLG